MTAKSLLLLRHAKSSWGDPALDDFDRPLAERGVRAAALVGREIARRDWLPEQALVSSARRTRETWALVAAQWLSPPPSVISEAIYEAAVDAILAEIRRTDETVGSLLVVGHNPGTEDLAGRLAGPASDAEALRRLSEKFPTAALARFVFDGRWSGLDDARGRLSHFIRPKDIA